MTVRPRASRRGLVVFLLFVLTVVATILYRSRLLFGLLLEDGLRTAIYPAELIAELEHEHDSHSDVIPKIIHQTYKNTSLPAIWLEQQNQTLALHEDYEYMFWTDASAYDFILENYPWFLETYESYPYNIQRVDAFRYFILLHYGGIYLDLDISTIRRLDPLLQYSAWSCRTYPTGISNDALGAAPNHPFYKRVTENLASYNKNWLLPYVTVMYTTGPLFLSVMWEEYIQSRHGEEKAMHSIFPDAEHFGNSYGFFNMTDGGTWHGKDLEVIMWMGDHWLLVTIGGILAGVTVVGLLAWVINRLTGSRPGNGYLRLEREMHIA